MAIIPIWSFIPLLSLLLNFDKNPPYWKPREK